MIHAVYKHTKIILTNIKAFGEFNALSIESKVDIKPIPKNIAKLIPQNFQSKSRNPFANDFPILLDLARFAWTRAKK